MGTVVPEALNAALRPHDQGFRVAVVCITSPGLVFEALQSRRGLGHATDWVLGTALPSERAAHMVTVLDGHPHTLAFLAGINGVPATHLGVSTFGQSGDLDNLYRCHGLSVHTGVGVHLPAARFASREDHLMGLAPLESSSRDSPLRRTSVAATTNLEPKWPARHESPLLSTNSPKRSDPGLKPPQHAHRPVNATTLDVEPAAWPRLRHHVRSSSIRDASGCASPT